jgi:MFS family permease
METTAQVNLFRAFRSTNYARYFTGRSVSQLGVWMQRTAVIWVVYSLTHNAFWIGCTIFAEQFPSFLFSILGGVVADRYNKYDVIRITQLSCVLQSILLATLVLTGHAAVWSILTLSVLLGIINAFDVPARQALIHDVLTDKSDLSNAVALTAATASLAQLLGPALAGIILNAWGAAVCFFINAGCFFAVIICLVLMKLPPYVPKTTRKHVFTELGEGLKYITETSNVGLTILLLAIVSLLVLPYSTVLPVFAKVVFKGDASTYGYISGFVGAGAAACTIFIAALKPGAPLKKILFVSIIIMAIGLIGFSQVRYFPLAMLFAAFTGIGPIACISICNITLQTEAAPEMRGRAIGILLMAVFGMLPVGSLLVGAVSQRIGAPITTLAEGIIALIIVLCFSRFLIPKKRPRYDLSK